MISEDSFNRSQLIYDRDRTVNCCLLSKQYMKKKMCDFLSSTIRPKFLYDKI